MDVTPAKKLKRTTSPVSDDVPAWALGAIRVLQKDVRNILTVVSNHSVRVAELENKTKSHDMKDFLQLPVFTPSVMGPMT
eukprot:10819009-Karenia_brevis.AAC.1